MNGQPNFLIIMADQLTGTLFDEAGPADFLHTPVLRTLAEHAVHFTNAYCPSPLCTPSRASFMSGRLPSATGVYDNAAEFPAAFPTFAHHLRILGYHTILSGKMHFVGPDQLHGFEERLTTDIYPADFGWTPDWRKPDERIDWWYHNLSSVTDAGVAATTNQLEFDDEATYQAKLKLYQLARRQHRQPFCLTVSFTHPHDPYVARRRYWDLYPESGLPPLKVAAIPYEQQDAHSRRLLHAVDFRRFTLSEQHISDARRAYFANISYLDERIGEILQVLDDCDFSDNTVILLCADHGDMLGERGLWFKMSFFEDSIRVPLWLHAPRRFTPRAVTQPVSTLDILPTLIELAGGGIDQQALQTDGSSLLTLAGGGVAPARAIAAEYAAEGSLEPMLMLREGDWKFNFCAADPPQLFNLRDDPHELDNLAPDSTYSGVTGDFMARIKRHWDIDRFRDDVKLSQARRLLVYAALRRGDYLAWDHQPLQRAAERYMRNHLDLNVLEANARYPRGRGGAQPAPRENQDES